MGDPTKQERPFSSHRAIYSLQQVVESSDDHSAFWSSRLKNMRSTSVGIVQARSHGRRSELIGRSIRPRPKRLASKLLQIRLTLGMTQQQMFERLGDRQSTLLLPHISDFKLDKRNRRWWSFSATPAWQLSISKYWRTINWIPAHLSGQAQSTQAVVFGQCPHCKAPDKQIKAGRNRSGSRRYQCRYCLRHYTPQPTGDYRPNRAHPPGPSANSGARVKSGRRN
jgi:hypothetical protein